MYTKLDIINAMIVSTGARPLTAQQSKHPAYSKAENLLSSVSLDLQSFGLWFNTECRTVKQQSNGQVIVPQGCIKADPVDGNYKLSLRGSRLYNLYEGSFQIGCDVELKMLFELPTEHMPVAAQKYIRTKAIFDFYLNEDGADPKLSNYRAEKDAAWSILYREHLANAQENIFNNPHNAVSLLRRGGYRSTTRIGGGY